jgi:hypothetical protein
VGQSETIPFAYHHTFETTTQTHSEESILSTVPSGPYKYSIWKTNSNTPEHPPAKEDVFI